MGVADVAAVLEALVERARHTPRATAIAGPDGTWECARLAAAVDELAPRLEPFRSHGVALRMDNSPAWATCDLAALRAGVSVVPLPGFFSPEQTRHALTDSGVAAVLAEDPEMLAGLGTPEPLTRISGMEVWQAVRPVGEPTLPAGCAKVTYTSGTTGNPKGVLLAQAAMERVAASLVAAVGVGPDDRHLAALPLPLLLENIAGLYAPLLAGAPVVLRPCREVGLLGAAGIDPERLWSALREAAATTTILTPQMLQALVEYLEANGPQPTALRFVAVGGARVPPGLLGRARDCGIPAYEGYGLSECASVVAVNRPGADRPGSAGRPLPHVQLRIADDGELWVAGALGEGYLGGGGPGGEGAFWPTGDLASLDDDGFIHLTGRKRHVYVTAFGRNVAPEWVEGEFMQEPAIAQAAVFGEARPTNAAVIWSGTDDAEVEAALAAANQRLPDYARVALWLRAGHPFSPENGQLTGTGRLRRDAILAAYGDSLERLWGRTQTVPMNEREDAWASTNS